MRAFALLVLMLAGCTTYRLSETTDLNSKLSYLPWGKTSSCATDSDPCGPDLPQSFKVEPGMALDFATSGTTSNKTNLQPAQPAVASWIVPSPSKLEPADYFMLGWLVETGVPTSAPSSSLIPWDAVAADGSNLPQFQEIILSTLEVAFQHDGGFKSHGPFSAAEMRDALCSASPAEFNKTTSEPPHIIFDVPTKIGFSVPTKDGESQKVRVGWPTGWFQEQKNITVTTSFYQDFYSDDEDFARYQLRTLVWPEIPIRFENEVRWQYVSPCMTVGELEATTGTRIAGLRRYERFLPKITANNQEITPKEAKAVAISPNGRFSISFYKDGWLDPHLGTGKRMISAAHLQSERCDFLLAPGDEVIAGATSDDRSCPPPN